MSDIYGDDQHPKSLRERVQAGQPKPIRLGGQPEPHVATIDVDTISRANHVAALQMQVERLLADCAELRRQRDATVQRAAGYVAEVERLKARIEVVDALTPANDLVRKMRAETDAADAAHIDALQLEAIEQRQRAERAEAEVERLKAANAEARDSLRIVTEDRKARTLERDRLVDTLNAARSEIEWLKANQPDGGQWRIVYGWPDESTGNFLWCELEDCEGPVDHDVQRRVWYGPVQSIRPYVDPTQPVAAPAVTDAETRTGAVEGDATCAQHPEAQAPSEAVMDSAVRYEFAEPDNSCFIPRRDPRISSDFIKHAVAWYDGERIRIAPKDAPWVPEIPG